MLTDIVPKIRVSKPKRKVISTPSPTEQKLLTQIQTMKEPYKSYAAFLYLYGTRVSEGIGLRRITAPRTSELITEPIKKWDFTEEKGMLFIRNIRVFKRKDRPYMDKYVLSEEETEEPFIKILKEYLATKKPENTLWNFDRTTFYKHLRRATDLFPHKLRGMRATKDVNRYDLTIIDLKKKNGWTQDKQPMTYVSLAESDVIKKLRRKVQ